MNTVAKEWTDSQIYRRMFAEEGDTVVASKRKHGDTALIAWAEKVGLAVDIDRGTPWGNPFEMSGERDRDTVCDKYADYLAASPALLDQIPALKGKVLVCWCHPKRCHGDFLAKLANAIVKVADDWASGAPAPTERSNHE